MVQISVEYKGDLRCESIHEPSGAKLETDAPRDNQGLGAAFSPTDLLATSLSTCMATTMGIVAKRESVEITGMRLSMVKEMTQTPPRKVARLSVEIWVPIHKSHPAREKLEHAAMNCPVYLSLHPEIEKPVCFYYSE